LSDRILYTNLCLWKLIKLPILSGFSSTIKGKQ
jgi:hypothetical protein